MAPAPLTSSPPWWLRLRTEHVFFLVPLAILGICVGLAPLAPSDFWWHLRVGQLIVEQGRVPGTALFGWSIPSDTPYVYGAWLAEAFWYLLFTVGGPAAVIFLRGALLLAAYTLVGLVCVQRSGSWKLAAVGVGLAGAMTLNNLNVRPQNWSWLLFATFLWLLHCYAAPGRDAARPAGHLRWLLPLPFLMVLWVNLHGAFVLGLVLIGGFALGETMARLLRQPGALVWRQVAGLYVAGVACLAALLANPHGAGVFAWVRSLTSDPATQELIAEWQPPTPSGFVNVVFFGSILLVLAVFALGRRRPTPTDLVLLLLFLWLAWTGQRYAQWYAMVAASVVTYGLGPRARSGPTSAAETVRGGGIPSMNALLAAILLLPVLLVQPWLLPYLPLPADYLHPVDGSGSMPVAAVETPVQAVGYLRDHPGGRIFNDMSFGSYLIWAAPAQPVFVDPRIEVYPRTLVLDYLKAVEGVDALQILDRYQADRVLLSVRYEEKLSAALGRSGSWHREYADEMAEIWRRDGPAAPPG